MTLEFINDLNYNYIKYFVSVAQHGSILKASQSLKMSQSALSQAMKNLERDLDITLFSRNTRGIVLTEEGKALYEKSLQGVKAFRQAIIQSKNVTQAENGFKISTSHACFEFCVLNNLQNIIKNFPNLNFEFIASTMEFNVVKSLQNNECDIAIIKGSNEFSSKEIETKLIKKIHYVMTYNPKFFTIKDEVSFEELNKFPILFKMRNGRRDSSWLEYSFSHTVCCHDDSTVLDLIKEGVGIGLLPKEVAERYDLKNFEVAGVPKIEVNIMACYNESNELAKNISKLLVM